MSTDLNLVRFIGNDAVLTLALVHPDTGLPFDPKEHVLLFTVKLSPSQSDIYAKMQKDSREGGFTASVGKVVIELVPTDWEKMKAGISYYFDVLAQHLTTRKRLTVSSGRLNPAAVVTQTIPIPEPIAGADFNPDFNPDFQQPAS